MTLLFQLPADAITQYRRVKASSQKRIDASNQRAAKLRPREFHMPESGYQLRPGDPQLLKGLRLKCDGEAIRFSPNTKEKNDGNR